MRDGEAGTDQRSIRIVESAGSTLGGEGGGPRDIPSSGGGTWRGDGATSDMSTSEEQEQGQEEGAKFRCEMLAERFQRLIQVEAPSWSAGEKTGWMWRPDRCQGPMWEARVWEGLSGQQQRYLGSKPPALSSCLLSPFPPLSLSQGRFGPQRRTEDRVSGKSQILPAVGLPF